MRFPKLPWWQTVFAHRISAQRIFAENDDIWNRHFRKTAKRIEKYRHLGLIFGIDCAITKITQMANCFCASDFGAADFHWNNVLLNSSFSRNRKTHTLKQAGGYYFPSGRRTQRSVYKTRWIATPGERSTFKSTQNGLNFHSENGLNHRKQKWASQMACLGPHLGQTFLQFWNWRNVCKKLQSGMFISDAKFRKW